MDNKPESNQVTLKEGMALQDTRNGKKLLVCEINNGTVHLARGAGGGGVLRLAMYACLMHCREWGSGRLLTWSPPKPESHGDRILDAFGAQELLRPLVFDRLKKEALAFSETGDLEPLEAWIELYKKLQDS